MPAFLSTQHQLVHIIINGFPQTRCPYVDPRKTIQIWLFALQPVSYPLHPLHETRVLLALLEAEDLNALSSGFWALLSKFTGMQVGVLRFFRAPRTRLHGSCFNIYSSSRGRLVVLQSYGTRSPTLTRRARN